jgi:hypothetical protein
MNDRVSYVRKVSKGHHAVSLFRRAPLARAMTEFRFEGLGAAEKQAEVFGYKGAQFPWCTVSFGRSAGCCDGKGGEELCLEQHITPDVVRTPSTPLFFLFFIAP